jgi:hypothetical protein
MRKNDISSLNDIYKLIAEQVDESGGDIKASSDAKYDKLGQNLRENQFVINDSPDGTVLFYTMKPASDDENDKLHNAAGPAVVFGSGGPGNEFYFIEGKLMDKDSKEYRAAAAEVNFSATLKAGGDEAGMEDVDFSEF